MKAKILISGGGTGGHIYPALAVIQELSSDEEIEFQYVGGKNGAETAIVANQGLDLKTIWIAGIMRGLSLKNLTFPLKLAVSLMQSWRILRAFRPDLAIGTGGYVTGPILFCAAKMGIPVLIVEPDVHPGLTTRLLAKHVQKICVAYEAAKNYLGAFVEKIVVTGNPVRIDVAQGIREKGLKNWNLLGDRLTLFVFGGSQGARSINMAMVEMARELVQKYPLQILWQTGLTQFAAVQENLEDEEPHIKVVPYIEDMKSAYAVADIVLSRAGSGSLAELALVAKPAVLIPYPYATADHQKHNASVVEEAGAAAMIVETDDFKTRLRSVIEQLLSNASRREEMAEAWHTLARPEAARRIADEALELIRA